MIRLRAGKFAASGSVGCNRLLRDGASVVTEAADILDALHLQSAHEQQAARIILPENADEAAIFARLTQEPSHLDEVVRASGLPVGLVSSTLVMMELKGMVRQVAPLQYIRAHEPSEPYLLSPSP